MCVSAIFFLYCHGYFIQSGDLSGALPFIAKMSCIVLWVGLTAMVTVGHGSTHLTWHLGT